MSDDSKWGNPRVVLAATIVGGVFLMAVIVVVIINMFLWILKS